MHADMQMQMRMCASASASCARVDTHSACAEQAESSARLRCLSTDATHTALARMTADPDGACAGGRAGRRRERRGRGEGRSTKRERGGGGGGEKDARKSLSRTASLCS
eukprot:1055588-Rhodomonas_salina.1